jgi:hypothetical protein
MRQPRLAAACIAALATAATIVAAPVAVAAPPANDDISAAVVISTLPFTDTTDTTEATTAPDDPSCVGNAHTVWYRLTTSADLTVVATTAGSDFDTTLSAYTGSRGSLTQIACNDDTNGLTSRITFEATAGTTYWLMAGSFADTAGGQLVLTVDELPPPVALDVTVSASGTVTASGVARVRGGVTCSRPVEVDVVGSLRQSRRGSVSLGYFATTVACDGSTAWSATAPGETGPFRRGEATARVTATVDDLLRGEVVRRYVERTLTLRRG